MQKADGDSVGYTLGEFISDYGTPEHMTFDGAAVQVGSKTKFMKTICQAGIKYHISAPRRPNENPVKGAIREIKSHWYRLQMKKDTSARLRDFALSWICEAGNVIATNSRYSKGITPLEIITGIIPDISEYLDFGFYDWVTFRSNVGLGPLELG